MAVAELGSLGIIHTLMKNILPVIALGLILTGCSKAPSDTKVSKSLPGSWHMVPLSAEQSGNKIIFTIAPNGDFTRHGVSSDGVHSSLDIAGTLKVQDGYLIETITNSSQRNAHLPRITREKIIRADDHEIVFTVEGMTNQITIQKDTP